VIMTDKPNVKVSWQVTGVRNDKWAQKNRIIPEPDKKGSEKGKYLYPELYGKSRDEGIINPHFGPADKGTIQNKQAAQTGNDAMQQVNNAVKQKTSQLNQTPQVAPDLQPAETKAAATQKTNAEEGKMQQMSKTVPVIEPDAPAQKPKESPKEPAEASKTKKLSETVSDPAPNSVQDKEKKEDKTKQLQEKKKLVTPDPKLGTGQEARSGSAQQKQ